MSIILDALRKSEAERQRQSGPGLADAGHRPPARRRSLWLPLLVLVLTANLGLGGYLLLRDRAPPAVTLPTADTAPATERPTLPAAPATAVAPAPAAPAPPPQQIELLREDAPYQPMADLPALEPETPDAVDPPATLPVPPPAVSEPAPASGSIREGLPTVDQLAARGELSLPPLHVDIHVFSDVPAERFVFINQRKYTEGSQLSEGPLVEEITPEGAILSQGGQRFLLTRD